jgi:hypothetical protein
LLDRILLRGRELRLQLVGDGFGDLALNGEDIGQIAIVSLRPEMSVVAGVDELRVHPHLVGGALHAPLQQVSDTKLLSNFP